MLSIKKVRWVGVVAACLLLMLALLVPGRALAQADEPVVYAVLLYSPQCGHCHEFIENEWPKMHEEFGEQFQLLFVDVTGQGGRELALQAYETYGIPSDQRYVPMMLIGEHVLVGGMQIPTEGREIIREGLANGGIDLPPIPGLREAYEAALAQQTAADATQAAPEAGAEAEPENPGSEVGSSSQQVAEAAEPAAAPALGAADTAGGDTIGARLARDPLANGLAVAVLLGLTASLAAVVVAAGQRTDGQAAAWLEGGARWLIALIVALAALGIGITLIARAGGDGFALGMAGLVSLLMLAAVVALALGRGADLPGWLLPAVALAGLAAAAYLAYVEVGQQQAVCGAVGDCNTVQQSPYARLFGVLPIGVLGVAGYVVMLGTWAVAQFGSGRLADAAQAALLGLALFGVVFSIYLTFLEPFVIGATCAWCLTSALVMLLLLWLTAPSGWESLRRLRAG